MKLHKTMTLSFLTAGRDSQTVLRSGHYLKMHEIHMTLILRAKGYIELNRSGRETALDRTQAGITDTKPTFSLLFLLQAELSTAFH